MSVRAALMWIHLALGLTASLFLAVVGVTGVYITFQRPLERWLNPVPAVTGLASSVDLPALSSSVEARFAPRRVVTVDLNGPNLAATVRLRDRTVVFLRPSDGTIVGSRPARVASLENLTAVMRRLHTNLLLGPKGRWLVTFATAEALLLVLTGLWLWWRKKHWSPWPLRGSLFRVSWDLHNASGIWFAVPLLAMVATGLLLAMPSPVYRLAGASPAPWPNPPASAAVDTREAPISLSRALAVADSVRPGEPVVGVFIPGTRAGAFAIRTDRETVFVDQYHGGLIEVRPHRAPTAGDHAMETVEHLHTGELFGVPGQVLMTLGSLMLAVMTLTGVVLGVKRVQITLGKQISRE